MSAELGFETASSEVLVRKASVSNFDESCMDAVIKIINEYVRSEDPSELIKHLLDVGAQFGHPTRAWNPLMAGFIMGTKSNCHMIDLRMTVRYLMNALEYLYLAAKSNQKILFVCTSDQMSEIVQQEAKRCMQYYISDRWLGGTLTNWNTVKKSIQTLHNLEGVLEKEGASLKKKERLMTQRRIDGIRKALGGIENMGDLPDVVIISSIVKENIAVDEVLRLQKLGMNIKSIGFADTNSNPLLVDFPIPCNDDSMRVIEFMLRLFSNVVIEGLIAGDNASADELVKELMPEHNGEADEVQTDSDNDSAV